MNITVVGCGKIGSAIVESLVLEGHDVTAVDNNPNVISHTIEHSDCMGICGSGTDYETLMEAKVQDCNLFIAVTESDELNILSCFMAKKLGAKYTIARIRNPEYSEQELEFMKEHLGISMAINPELLAALDTFNVLKLPSAMKVETFNRRSFEMVEHKLREGSPLDGLSLMEMRKKFPAKYLVSAVSRADEVFIPSGDFVLKSGDRIGITASPTEAQKLFKQLGLTKRQCKNVMILGASRTSYYLAKLLLESGSTVKIIDTDVSRCDEFCESLPEAIMIHGDAAGQDVLLEEGLKTTDAFAALTGMDEENVLMSLFASSNGVPKVVAKINTKKFSSLAEKIGIESIVSPGHSISDVIVSYARGLQNSIGSKMETLYKIMDGGAEALEFKISDDCPIKGKPLKDLELKRNILLAGIIRKRKPFIPSGEDMILPGDMVVVLAAGQRINDITDIVK